MRTLIRLAAHTPMPLGIELCEPRKVSSFVMARVPKVKKLMQKRNIRMDQEVVAPVDIYKAV